jgi:anti-sigma factor RsiW
MTESTPHLTEDQLQGYLDGVLEPGLAEQVQRHLVDCAACQGELERLEDLSLQLESLPALELSRDLSGPILSRLRQERDLTPAITWTLVIEALGAGAVIAALIPVLQAAGWLPRVVYTGKELQAGLNIFLAQLASSWLVWWAELQLQIRALGLNLLPLGNLSRMGLSPWILIGAAGGLGLLLNFLLLGRQPLPTGNHQDH